VTGALTGVIAGLLILVGLIGTVVPVLPGLALVWAAALGWGLIWHTPTGWTVAVLATVLLIVGVFLRIVVPGRRLQGSDVSGLTLAAGLIGAVIGFFVLPFLGLLIGFVAGIFLLSWYRLGSHRLAWPATWVALKAIGVGALIEAGTAVAIAGVWLVGVIVQTFA